MANQDALRKLGRNVTQILAQHGIYTRVLGVVEGPMATRVNIERPWRAKHMSSTQRVATAAHLLRSRGLYLAPNVLAIAAERIAPSYGKQYIPFTNLLHLAPDMAVALRVDTVRIGQDNGGVFIEVPREHRVFVPIAQAFAMPEWSAFVRNSALPLHLGVSVQGKPVFFDLAQGPHAVVAGTTGSGKSHTLHTFIASLHQSQQPIELFLVDFKQGVELSLWDKSPLVKMPTLTAVDACAQLLQELYKTTLDRSRTLKNAGVRTIAEYRSRGGLMPYIILIIDEIAVLALGSQSQIAETFVRLSQMARTAGVHVVIATQRPSADIVRGTILANYSFRVVHSVASPTDSRVALGVSSSELGSAHLLRNMGDALVKMPTLNAIVRTQVPYIDRDTIAAIIKISRRKVGIPDD